MVTHDGNTYEGKPPSRRQNVSRAKRTFHPAATTAIALLLCGAVLPGCGDDAILFLNPSFVNQTQGGLFPLVPRPDSGLLLVRVRNTTNQPISFLVTIERGVPTVEGGDLTTTQTNELFTTPGSQSNETGILHECTPENPITRIGLGRNLNQPTADEGLFVGAFTDLEASFGVPGNINPLASAFGDFFCGDTVIYQVIDSNNAPGGFKVQAFILPFEQQPADTERDTFGVASDFLRNRPGG